jgi:hypothetical protein
MMAVITIVPHSALADSGNGGDPNSESSGGDLPTCKILCSVIK